jgi:hypothetical protein
MADAEMRAAAEANRVPPAREELLDALVRYAIGACKEIERGEPWQAVVCVEEVRYRLTLLRGRRDTLELDPASPGDALAKTLAEVRAWVDLGEAREELLARLGI